MVDIDFGFTNTSSPVSTCFATLTLAVDPQPMVLPRLHGPSCVGKRGSSRTLPLICEEGWGDEGVRQAREDGNIETSFASFSFDCEGVPSPKLGEIVLTTTIRSRDMDSLVMSKQLL